MKKYLPILTKCPLFSGMDEESILAILQCIDAQVSKSSKNKTIFRAGTPARYAGIMLSGRVQVIQLSVSGSHHIIGTFDASQVFGAAYACSSAEALPVSIIASLDSEILLLDCRRILNVCSSACAYHTQLISNLLRIVADRIVLSHQKLDVVTKRTTRDKLLSFLYLQARQSGSNRFTLSYNRQQLADYLGVSRCAMTTELTKLQKDRIIVFHRNAFEILQPPEEHST